MPSERCPVCGVKVKSENLSRHIKKVHPDAEAGAEKKAKKARRPSVGGRKAIYAVVAVIIIVVLVASAFVLLPAAEEPKIGVEPSSYDFGTIPRVLQTVNIEVRNDGEANLEITRIWTSCMCTSAVLRVGGRNSPVFQGDSQTSWIGETLLPGQHGYLDVTYDPTYIPDSGSIARAVYIQSNDPDRSEVQVTITAYVTP
ncbi:MAG: DUF1573 domain-containing protein [Thermoplasmata archaeon]|nr:DUF1573 domain-containing protein [Candidatus Thermoplasmatota archaeon]MCK4949760.1 DUF1573 domain-containing protein [Thermoplasmata archaeon]